MVSSYLLSIETPTPLSLGVAPSVFMRCFLLSRSTWSGERGGSASGHLSVACRLAPYPPPPSGGGGAGVGSLAADALFPLLLVC